MIRSVLWLTAPAMLLLCTGAADWPQFLGPNRNGAVADTLPAWPKDGPSARWQRSVGEGFSGPIVVGDRLVLFHRLGEREVLEAMDASTGRVLWKSDYATHYQDDFGFEEGPRATPCAHESQLFTYGADGMISAWALTNGMKQWSVDAKSEFGSPKGFFGRACSPLVEGEAVILNVGGRNGAGIVALARSNGHLLWKATEDEASYSSPVSAVLGGVRRVVMLTRGHLVVMNPSDGRVLVERPFRPANPSSVTAATPLVLGEQLFISASYGAGAALLQWREKRLDTIWEEDHIMSCHYATCVQHEGFLYGFDGRQEQGCVLRCVELANHRVRWSEPGLKAGTVTLAGRELLVLTEGGQLLRAPASPETFKVSARAQLWPDGVRAHPALADGRFYARSKNKLICVDLNHR
jgi:hypothetical protein